MQQREGRVVLSATDVTKHVACPHVTTLDLAVAQGRLPRPEDGVDAQLQLIFDKGLEHEADYLASLYAAGAAVTEIPEQGSLAERETRTIDAMRAGAEVIFQAALFDGHWVGFADFLIRVERPSAFGPWSYDIADTKLARRLKVPALLQMATYAVRLGQLQGVAPRQLTVIGGDGKAHPWRLVDVDAYAARVRGRLLTAIEESTVTEAVPTAYCEQCRWLPRCRTQWIEADDLSVVAGMRGDQRARLQDAGVPTLTELAQAGPDDSRVVEALSATTRVRLTSQAALQLSERRTGEPAYRLWPAVPAQGLGLLPDPDPGDVYLDFEGDPFAPGGQGLEYLAGICERDGTFRTWWAHDAAAEARMVSELLEWLMARWREHPGMHIYHYANYEQAVLKRLTAREAVAESDLDMLLRGERFVDLYAVVRQGVQISKDSYSIKKLEAFYWGKTRSGAPGAVDNALSSVVEYERWANSDRQDHAILDRIADYNYDDVRSTLALHDWLEDRRADLAATPGGAPPRPGQEGIAEAADTEAMQAENALAAELREAGHLLLAGCIGWHRREDKQVWWDYYRTTSMSREELVEDRNTLGGLGTPTQVGEIKRSYVWRYPFPPQEGRVTSTMHDAHEHKPVGDTVACDLDEGWIDVKRGKANAPLPATALISYEWVNNTPLRGALKDLGAQVLSGGGGAGRALLERIVPTDLEPVGAESAVDVVRRCGVRLSGQVLAVQGPPGSGKTYAGQHLIRDLLDAGLRVGVTATSHSVLAQLLRKTGRPAVRKVTANQMPSEVDEVDPDDTVVLTDSQDRIIDALGPRGGRLAGGTAWLWARPEMRASVDVLVIDEAGQFSLANALAVAGAADSIVLLGDPQQLASPSNGTHPYGAGVSALEHMLDGAAVMPTGRGVFLDRTWRMHPDITAFVSTMSYDDRLETADGRDGQRVLGVPIGGDADANGIDLNGSGLRWVPRTHRGYSSDNPEEAELVAELSRRLLQGRWIDALGHDAALTAADLLVVAPYNAHVAALAEVLPEGVAVGTVDKFQGREAAVVIYTMASSSAADAPRGVDFLYDTHRLNVAISRAKALAVIVASPDLLEAPVNTPEQLRAVNALCRFVDAARA
ncbi:MAG: TM0106 family RecB-like putative nuclease [Ornithinimicrobium sp.]